MKKKSVISVDLGASSGRVILLTLLDNTLHLEEVHRFSNEGIHIQDRIYTDLFYLFQEILTGLQKVFRITDSAEAFGIDTWGVDFALLDGEDECIAPPYQYRDAQAKGMIQKAVLLFKKGGLFSLTGVQDMWYNTVYQILGIQRRNPRIFENAHVFLMLADVLGYFFTGQKSLEYTSLSTTQLYDLAHQQLCPEILMKLHLSPSLFPEIVMTGTHKGDVLPQIKRQIGIPSGKKLSLIATAQHDSASAAHAVPAEDPHYIFINSGTWSIIGMVTDHPVITDTVYQNGFSNEGAAFGKVKLVKTIMGMWLIQELRRYWKRNGLPDDYATLLKAADEASAFACLIDPDDSLFASPENMEEAINQYCIKTKQPPLTRPGEFYRAVMESLAFKYRESIEKLEQITGHKTDTVHLLGGASQDKAFCQYIANATGKTVAAGPIEATAIGNALIQFRSLGYIENEKEAARLLKNSFSITEYHPQERPLWEEQYKRYQKVTALCHVGKTML
ncbi:rhamnulokinase [Mediterraneibacter massiliensis]|uniref:rhamnulokinase n=1 Tax=Mediterraneibacter massiliensis TaxID=1720300 RepID=UPI0024AD6D00|nr:rhamnulokinase family protein [Mediterraneibacter massiliensis]